MVSTQTEPWSREDLIGNVEEFSYLYQHRPIKDNTYGMKSPHLFYLWHALRKLQPQAVIESGVWKGQSTWLIEQTCPDAELHCIDINPRMEYRSSRATYYDRDFATIDWSSLPHGKTVVFFDDHQNAVNRLMQAKWFGFRHILFDDNYPPGTGDCYSLKEAFMGSRPRPAPQPLKGRVLQTLAMMRRSMRGEANYTDRSPNVLVKDNLEIYYEFPPVFKPEHTRWGDAWDDRYPTQEPLLSRVEAPWQQVFMDEAQAYTWMCYVRLK